MRGGGVSKEQMLRAMHKLLYEVRWVDFHVSDPDYPVNESTGKLLPGGYAGIVAEKLAYYLNEELLNAAR